MDSRRRDFILPTSDISDLNQLGFNFDCIKENGQNWVVLRDYPVPPGFNAEVVDIAILINPRYPISQLDMAYFYPPLERIDGVAIPRDCFHTNLEGKVYKGWSRHRNNANTWRSGIDNICSHLVFVNDWFHREFNLRPRKDDAA